MLIFVQAVFFHLLVNTLSFIRFLGEVLFFAAANAVAALFGKNA